MTEDVRALVEHRLLQAVDALSSARADRAAGRLAGALNRGYYTMFYSSLALLASRQIGTSKHSGLIAKISEHFVKTGALPPHLGRALNQAFDLRQKSDYREFFTPTSEQADQIISWAEEFLTESRSVLFGT